MKQILSVFTGLVAAVLIIFIAQMLREGLFPQLGGMQFGNQSYTSDWISNLPTNAFIIIAISHGLAAFAAGLIASLTSEYNRMVFGLIAASIVFIIVMIYLFTYNFPTLFVVADTITTFLLASLGVVTGSGRYIKS